MKYVLFLCDGMADYRLQELGGRTPLEVAETPNMDKIAREGATGLVRTIPEGLAPGSDIATLSILGYDPRKYYSGRGSIEALNIGIESEPDEQVFRCNLVTTKDGVMLDYSGGHISSEDGAALIEVLNNDLAENGISFYPGVSYRNILTIKEQLLEAGEGRLECTPPHDITGREIEQYLPRGKGADKLNELMQKSIPMLEQATANRSRIERGEEPANMIWPWGGGKLVPVPSLKEKFGLTGSIITAVDLLKGIGKLTGLKAVDVPGATGYYDTDYNAKARYAIEALKTGDLVFIHVEAADEAGHNADVKEKIKAIENFDAKIIGPVMNALKGIAASRVLLMPDHLTPISIRTHSAEPVPAAIAGCGVTADEVKKFDEFSVESGKLGTVPGHELLKLFTSEEI